MFTLIRDPLVHFLLIGAALFFIYGLFNTNGQIEDPRTITVDQQRLMTHMQYRARAFDPERVSGEFARLEPQALEQLIADYVQEEALYREARELQLDSNDYVARLRLIQRLEFTLRGFIDNELPLTQADLERYWEQHHVSYVEPATVTFTHVFFSRSRHGDARARELAENSLTELNHKRIPFEGAGEVGDRFPYHLNYVERGEDMIASHLGMDMARRLFVLSPDDSTWQGPFESPHGYHVVLLTRQQAAKAPALADIHLRVMADAREALLGEKLDALKQAIIDDYNVELRALAVADEEEQG